LMCDTVHVTFCDTVHVLMCDTVHVTLMCDTVHVFICAVFVIIGTCIALQLGFYPRLMVFECLATMFLFYAAHWQAYCSGLLKFGL